MSSISQLQFSYHAVEDRLLLRLATTAGEEIRFWLTRRYAHLLNQALRAQVAADPDLATQPKGEAREAVRQFKQEAANSEGNFADAFRPNASFPLGETPLLAKTLTYKVDSGKLALTIAPSEGNGVNMVFDEKLNFNVTKLLHAACEKAEWGINWDRPVADPEGSGRQVN